MLYFERRKLMKNIITNTDLQYLTHKEVLSIIRDTYMEHYNIHTYNMVLCIQVKYGMEGSKQ